MKRAISDIPINKINHAQNWNHPVSVPANRKTLATTAPPTQNTKLPTVSAILLIDDLIHNLIGRITICNMPTPKIKSITAVKKPICCEGLAGASRFRVLEPHK
jgi:hypothetical protein